MRTGNLGPALSGGRRENAGPVLENLWKGSYLPGKGKRDTKGEDYQGGLPKKRTVAKDRFFVWGRSGGGRSKKGGRGGEKRK